MPISYDYRLVVLSVLVSVFASYIAIDLASRVAASRKTADARYWLAGGALAMGISIWSMHFIGMLAAEFPMSTSYDIPITLLSLIPAVAASGVALYTVSRETLTLPRLLLGGSLMGGGIASMHYIGMLAMQMATSVQYDFGIFSLSIVIAVFASIAAMWMAFRLRSDTLLTAFWKTTGSAIVMGVAICGMHYTGMAAIIGIEPKGIQTVPDQNINNAWVGSSVAGFAFMFMLMALALSFIEVRSQRRFRDLTDAMPMIVWTANPDGTLVNANRAMNDYAGILNASLSSGGWLEAVHPEDKARCLEVWGEAVRTGEHYSIEFRVRNRNDGRYYWHLVRAVPIRSKAGTIIKWYGTAIDIDERRSTEEEVNRLASRLRATLESITDAFYTLDRQWRFTYMNKEAERLLRRDSDDLVGKVLWEEFPELHGTPVSHEYWRAIRERSTVQFEYHSLKANAWLDIHVYPSDEGLAVYSRDITERKQAEDTIQFLALYDPLTKLPNRSLLQDRLQHALTASVRSQQQGAVLFLDLDNFKVLNDTLGHGHGDLLLEQVAARLTACVRKEDTVGRFGGDEFVLILEKLGESAEKSAHMAEAIGEKVRSSLSYAYWIDGYERHITPSIGVTLFGGDKQDTWKDVLKRADFAMYQAKAEGRNTVRLFDPAMQAVVNARVELETELREGLHRCELLPYYQPQVDAAGRITGAEALARWQHPERGFIPPAEFIPVAEESGLILPLGRYMLKAVCTQLAIWEKDPDTACLTLAVNVSAREFHHPDFVARVLEVIREEGANPYRLKLEITESLFLDDMEDTISKMTALKVRGVTFSLDDFGTGYSSLYYLKRLPLEQLKIDQRFVRDVLTDPTDAAIVRSVIILAHSLGLGVIAEGVETKEVRDTLARHGCSDYQGYYFSRPLPIEQFEVFRREQALSQQLDDHFV